MTGNAAIHQILNAAAIISENGEPPGRVRFRAYDLER